MKYLLYTLIAFGMISCADDSNQANPRTLVFQVKKNGSGPLVPITITDNDDGTGTMVARILFDNMDSKFDMIIDEVTDDKSNFTFTPAPGETISIGKGTHTGTYWTDSIYMVLSYNLGGFDFVDRYEGTR